MEHLVSIVAKMNGAEALDARFDFLYALETDGSDCVIRTKSLGVFDSYGIVITPESVSDESTLCFPSVEASAALKDAINNNINLSTYELYMKLYSDTEITKNQTIVFGAKEYEIIYASKKIYQNEVIFYEILVKK